MTSADKIASLFTAAAVCTTAIVALAGLHEAKKEWLVLPAPENFAAEHRGKWARLTWDPPARHADQVRHYELLRRKDHDQVGDFQRIAILHRERRAYEATLPKRDDAVFYRLQAVGRNNKIGYWSDFAACERKGTCCGSGDWNPREKRCGE